MKNFHIIQITILTSLKWSYSLHTFYYKHKLNEFHYFCENEKTENHLISLLAHYQFHLNKIQIFNRVYNKTNIPCYLCRVFALSKTIFTKIISDIQWNRMKYLFAYKASGTKWIKELASQVKVLVTWFIF